MVAIQVGKPLNPNSSSWPPMPEYNFIEGSHELIISYPNPRPQEIAAVWEAAARPFPDDYGQQAEMLFVNYSTKQLRQRALASCTGGTQHDNPAPF